MPRRGLRGAKATRISSTLSPGIVPTTDLIGATALLDQVLACDPGEPESLTSKAALLRRQGRLRDAVLHCDAAIRSAPDYPDAWLERGFVFASGGSMERARECFGDVPNRH